MQIGIERRNTRFTLIGELAMEYQWFYAYNGQKNGPVDEVVLSELISSGKVNADTLVWNRSMKAWTPVSQVSAFAGVANVPPPMPGASTRSAMTFFIAKTKATFNFLWAKFTILPRLTKVGVIAGAVIVVLVGWIWIFADHRSTQEQINDSNRARNEALNERIRQYRESLNP